MAGEAYYNTGTATVAVNSKTVTGTGTNWLSTVGGLTAIKAGDKFGIHVGRPIIIASVDSNTQLTLEDNWPGPAQTNAAYKIELTSPSVIAVEAMRRLLGSLGSGVLYGLSQLPSTPGRLLGIDENGLTALLATIPNAQLPTRLWEYSIAVTDANLATAFGSYSVAFDALNIPEAGAGSLLVLPRINSNQCAQKYIRIATGTEWTRVQTSTGAWSAWTRTATLDGLGFIANAQLPARLREISTAVSDANLAVTSGTFQVLSNTTNIPEAANGTLYVVGFNATAATQVYVRLSNGATYVRAQNGGTWGAWSKLPSAQTSATDATAGAAMLVGAFGLGGAGILLTNTNDLNTLPNVTAVYRMSSASPPSNMPTPVQSCVLVNTFYSAGAASQMLLSVNSSLVWYRQQAGNVWGAWTRMDGDVSGPAVAIDNAPVGFSGTSGKSIKQITGPVAALHAVTGAANKLPYFTGAAAMATTDLTAFGRSLLDDADAAAAWTTLGAGQSLATNGWQRLPSGLIIQWGRLAVTGGNVAATFPVAFPNACYVVVGSNSTEGQDGVTAYVGWADVWSVTGFAARGRFINSGGMGQAAINLAYIAIGR